MNNHAETKAVKAVIENYMNGTYQADIEKLKGVFHEKAVMNGYLGIRLLDSYIPGIPGTILNIVRKTVCFIPFLWAQAAGAVPSGWRRF